MKRKLRKRVYLLVYIFSMLFVMSCSLSHNIKDLSAASPGNAKIYGDRLKYAANQGDPTSQYILGYMYFNGIGYKKDYYEARKWWGLAAKQETHWYSSSKKKEAIGLAKNNLVIVNQLLQEDKPGYSPVVIVDKTPVVVKNDRSTMVGNSLVWEYDLEGPIGKPAKVSLSLNIDGKKYDWKDLDIKGDVGEVFPGVGKRVWWNILKDFPGNISKNIDWELSAEE